MKTTKVLNEAVETRVIGFSLASRSMSGWRSFLAVVCEKNAVHGLTIDATYSCNNGGVCGEFKLTGPAWVLDRIARRYGYGY